MASMPAGTTRIKWILLLVLVLVVLLIGDVSSDFAEDKKECSDKLIGLSPCLTFTSGDSKTPSPACCTELSKTYNTTKRCLCILVRDRNEPELGVKINATLALSLPFICHVPHANVSDCPELLHLAPGSPDAQVFEQFNSSLASTNVNDHKGDVPKSSSSSVKRRWVGFWKVGKVSIWLFVIPVFINHV